ncbi:AraC family transcriptional regulator [Telmatospirillum sp.]|uniref:AraC family transcriptional regulator n=1 Tax=Telmatospirillum sp. TaxID=2079197 RepID=UPI00283E37FE|nr:AraC family transcriptional regulator [Telmatospirillum sp.]MDR3440466.1 AraC family transcriptional regulator [Telmatospirillum sp.]
MLDPQKGFDRLYNVKTPPTFLNTSDMIGWKGTFFAKVVGSQYNIAQHNHENFCLQLFSLPREQRLLKHSARWQVREAGTQIFLPGDESRHENRGTPSRNQFLLVEPERVEEIIGRPLTPDLFAAFRGHPVQSAMVSNLMTALAQDLDCGCPAGRLVGETLVVALLLWVARSAPGAPSERRGSFRLSDMEMSRLKDFIDANLEQPISLDQLSGVVGISLRHFRRMLHQTVGRTPHQLVLSRRLERARQMIDQGRTSLAEIAAATGFSDQSHMTRVFRHHLGVSPSACRTRC